MTDRLTQRALLYELKRAIDRARRSPQPRWVSAALRLAEENPQGMKSKHITYNLGQARRGWLAASQQLDATPQDDSLGES